MKRHDFLKMAGLSVAAVSVPVMANAAETKAGRPNILYILCDDLGFGDVQCLNPQKGRIKTPNIDNFAKQGMTFTDAHSGSSVCTPTRYGILTGRYSWRSRLQKGVLDGGDDAPLIAGKRLTVPEFLGKQGYDTAAIGKWHLGFTSEKPGNAKDPEPKEKKNSNKMGMGKDGLPLETKIIGGPVTRGFDYYFGFSNARTMSSLIENDKVVEQIEPEQILPRLSKRACKYIAEHENKSKPFFMYLALNSPHTPIVPTAEWQGKSGLGKYGDFVMETDWVVGEVLAAIDKAGLAGNTLVIFTSDNGCSPQADVKGLEKQGHFPSAEMRGYKSDIWDGGHRIPFIARWPGKIKAGSKNEQLICLTDLMATCAEIIGEKLPDNAGEDSVSILPALTGTDKVQLREAVVHHSIEGNFSIRQNQWKLELCPGSGGWGKPKDADARKNKLPPVQLYDMSSDIGEQKNIQAEHKDVVEKLTKLLEKYIADGRSAPGAPQKNDVNIDILKLTEKADGQAHME